MNICVAQMNEGSLQFNDDFECVMASYEDGGEMTVCLAAAPLVGEGSGRGVVYLRKNGEAVPLFYERGVGDDQDLGSYLELESLKSLLDEHKAWLNPCSLSEWADLAQTRCFNGHRLARRVVNLLWDLEQRGDCAGS